MSSQTTELSLVRTLCAHSLTRHLYPTPTQVPVPEGERICYRAPNTVVPYKLVQGTRTSEVSGRVRTAHLRGHRPPFASSRFVVTLRRSVSQCQVSRPVLDVGRFRLPEDDVVCSIGPGSQSTVVLFVGYVVHFRGNVVLGSFSVELSFFSKSTTVVTLRVCDPSTPLGCLLTVRRYYVDGAQVPSCSYGRPTLSMCAYGLFGGPFDSLFYLSVRDI